MAVKIVTFDVMIIILPVLGARIIRRVDINAVNLSAMGIRQHFKRMVIFGIDHRMEGLISTSLERVRGNQTRIDWVPELRDHDEVVESSVSCLIVRKRGKRRRPGRSVHSHHTPEPPVGLLWHRSTRRKDPNFVSLSHRATGEFHRLRDVPFEVQAECPPVSEHSHFPFEVLGELRLLLSELAQ